MEISTREAKIEEELYHLFKTVLKKQNHRIEGVEFKDIEPQYPADHGRADLVLLLKNGDPLLEVECKRKVEVAKGWTAFRDFDPLGSRVIAQARRYAHDIGAPIFATTNGQTFAMFRTPEPGESFKLDKHRLLISEISLTTKDVEELLRFACRWFSHVPVKRTGVDWLFISRLRSFVNFLSRQLEPTVKRLERDESFAKDLEEFVDKTGAISSVQLAREAAYTLMNKLVFYKILERHYRQLPKLKPISAPDGASFVEFLKVYFEKAIEVTKDFEPVFMTGFFDRIPLPDVEYVFEEVNGFIEEMDAYRLEEVGSDVVGYIYEELLPPEERHMLGQFYTPPPIAELIVNWVIKDGKDKVMDPAVGSGTFLVKAYKRLAELKLARNKRLSPRNLHKDVLSQLYADDINPFPLQLTAMNLAMRDVRFPTSEMNLIAEDFFNLRPRQRVLTPYTVKTPGGEVQREIIIPELDGVVANPPYTRWVEIRKKTREAINGVIGKTLKEYGITGGIGNETGIYAHFIMFGHDFLKRKGRLGMIVSNSWLQAKYGIHLANFLLDRFKVKAIIDFNHRLFRIPLVATCVVLAEKEVNEKARNENSTVFVYVDQESAVEEILSALENPDDWKSVFRINVVRQRDIPKDAKWIGTLFGTDRIEEAIFDSPLSMKARVMFEPAYGNMSGVYARGGTGADKFFFLTESDVQNRGLEKYVEPLLASSRHTVSFTYTKQDWEVLRDMEKPCYVFLCHKRRGILPKNVKEFIRWGESTPLVKVRKGEKPKMASQSMASGLRRKDKSLFGWYDLGEAEYAPIFTSRRAQYSHRFVYTGIPLAFDDGLITFKPKNGRKLTLVQLKASLAFLNSSFSKLLVEVHGRSTGGGLIELDTKSAGELPLLNVRKANKKDVKDLAHLFEKLESQSREVGGAETQDKLKKLGKVIEEIDGRIVKILGLDENLAKEVRELIDVLSERRISRARRAKPETVRGEEEPRIRPPRKRGRKRKKGKPPTPLTEWM